MVFFVSIHLKGKIRREKKEPRYMCLFAIKCTSPKFQRKKEKKANKQLFEYIFVIAVWKNWHFICALVCCLSHGKKKMCLCYLVVVVVGLLGGIE